jgi:DNA-directed RNA polymerase specialized sigma24 family protein
MAGATSSIPDALWEKEWKQSLMEAAIENVKRQVSPKQFRLFYRCTVENQPAAEVAKTFERPSVSCKTPCRRTRQKRSTQSRSKDGLNRPELLAAKTKLDSGRFDRNITGDFNFEF